MRQIYVPAMLTILLALLVIAKSIPQENNVLEAYNPTNLYRENRDQIKASIGEQNKEEKWPKKIFIWEI